MGYMLGIPPIGVYGDDHCPQDGAVDVGAIAGAELGTEKAKDGAEFADIDEFVHEYIELDVL